MLVYILVGRRTDYEGDTVFGVYQSREVAEDAYMKDVKAFFGVK